MNYYSCWTAQQQKEANAAVFGAAPTAAHQPSLDVALSHMQVEELQKQLQGVYMVIKKVQGRAEELKKQRDGLEDDIQWLVDTFRGSRNAAVDEYADYYDHNPNDYSSTGMLFNEMQRMAWDREVMRELLEKKAAEVAGIETALKKKQQEVDKMRKDNEARLKKLQEETRAQLGKMQVECDARVEKIQEEGKAQQKKMQAECDARIEKQSRWTSIRFQNPKDEHYRWQLQAASDAEKTQAEAKARSEDPQLRLISMMAPTQKKTSGERAVKASVLRVPEPKLETKSSKSFGGSLSAVDLDCQAQLQKCMPLLEGYYSDDVRNAHENYRTEAGCDLYPSFGRALAAGTHGLNSRKEKVAEVLRQKRHE